MTDLVISLGTTDDTLIEGSEDFNISLTNALSSTGVSVSTDLTSDDVTTTILDTDPTGTTPDAAEWSLTGDANVNEGANASYTISLSGSFGEGEVVTVDLNLTDLSTNPSDYANIITAIQDAVSGNPDVTFDPTTGTLTYTSPTDGSTMTLIEIDLPIIDDMLIEGDEQYQLTLSNPTTTTDANVSVDPTANVVTTTINDDPVAVDDQFRDRKGRRLSEWFFRTISILKVVL